MLTFEEIQEMREKKRREKQRKGNRDAKKQAKEFWLMMGEARSRKNREIEIEQAVNF